MSIESPTWMDHVLASFILVLIPLYAVFVGQRRMKSMAGEFTSAMRISIYWSNSVFLWLAGGLCVAVTLLGGRALAEMGYQLTPIRQPWLVSGLLGVFLVVFTRNLSPSARRSKRWWILIPRQ